MSANIELFTALMSPESTIRQQAEATITSLKSAPLSTSVPIFLEAMQFTEPKVAQLATLIFKKTFLDDLDNLKKLPKETTEDIYNMLMNLIDFNKDWKTLQRIADAIAKIFQVKELSVAFNNVMLWFNSQSEVSREFALYLIDSLCDLKLLTDSVIENSVEDFKSLFVKGLSDNAVRVRVGTLSATTQFLNNLHSKTFVMKFTMLIPNIIDTLIYALKNDADKGRSALESLNVLTESYPKYWKEHLDTFINVLSEIIKEKSFSEAIRESALQLIQNLASKTPAFLRKSESFNKVFLPVLFGLLLELDLVNELDEWTKETEDNESDKEEMYFNAVSALEALSIDLGGKYFLEASIGYIKSFLAADDWVSKHAGFSCFSALCQACQDFFMSNIQEILQSVSEALVSEHPRVRYAALNTLGSLLEHLSPKIQKKYNQNILPALVKLTSAEEPNIRVRTHACYALVNFLKGLIKKGAETEIEIDIIRPYAKDLLQILSSLFEYSLTINYYPLQNESLTALSLLATILDKEFAPFYSHIMPGLKQIYYNLNPANQQQLELKSNAIETISYLISSVSDNANDFFGDFKELSEAFVKQLATLKEDDPQVQAILNAFTHLSLSMKEEFYPYLELLFPLLQQYIQADIDFKYEDADLSEYIEGESNYNSVILKLEGNIQKKLSLKTFTLQNKIMALTVLYDISLNMGTKFAPFLERFLGLCKSLLKFAYSRKIRKIAAKGFSSALFACSNDDEKRLVVNYMLPDLLSVFEHNIKNGLIRELKSYLRILTESFEAIEHPELLNVEHLRTLYSLMKAAVLFIEERKEKIKQLVAPEEGFDENDEDNLREDIDLLNEVIRSNLIFKI